MPIVSIESVVANGEVFSVDAIKQVAEELGLFWQTDAGQTWVKVRYLDEAQYAENGASDTPHPTFVEVLQRQLPAENELAAQAAEIAKIVANTLSLQIENVHVIYLTQAAGRIAFGGHLVSSE